VVGFGTLGVPKVKAKPKFKWRKYAETIPPMQNNDNMFAQRQPMSWKVMYTTRILNDGPIQILNTTA
jgi:hypothetical protein